MVELHHFMPLQTVLLGSYARLYAVALGLGRSVGLDDAALGLGGKQVQAAAPLVVPELVGDLEVAELGERVERSVPASPKRPREDGSATPKPKVMGGTSTPRDAMIASASASPRPGLLAKKLKQLDNGEPIAKKPKIVDPVTKPSDGIKTPRPVVGEDDVPRPKKPKADDGVKKPKKPTAGDDDLVPKAKKLKAEAAAQPVVGTPAPTPKVKKPNPEAGPTPKLKKKKKRDAMDDIFGF